MTKFISAAVICGGKMHVGCHHKEIQSYLRGRLNESEVLGYLDADGNFVTKSGTMTGLRNIKFNGYLPETDIDIATAETFAAAYNAKHQTATQPAARKFTDVGEIRQFTNSVFVKEYQPDERIK
jgi:hypothetical protein